MTPVPLLYAVKSYSSPLRMRRPAPALKPAAAAIVKVGSPTAAGAASWLVAAASASAGSNSSEKLAPTIGRTRTEMSLPQTPRAAALNVSVLVAVIAVLIDGEVAARRQERREGGGDGHAVRRRVVGGHVRGAEEEAAVVTPVERELRGSAWRRCG